MANGNKKFWIGTLVGSVVGSVVALFLAPKSGSELRADIAEHKDNFLTATREKAVGIQQQWSEWRQADNEAELTVLDDTVDAASEEAEKELEGTHR
ncbi:YtxH domain-containing protein [Paenibacillus popilliae]|uniref:Gas vesicle protein n=1 Tax=Paenibacillus popilliae ATCC 14706 TaxID=1212764 RepID=M9LXU7_PAEPP|nr:YtxH domain-containing protein [Paenibacillus popilliae]GAC40869.1 gas vesicle protein [Paenibacillus popilliae ATCC 14706]